MSKTFYGIGYNSKRKHPTKNNGKPTYTYMVWYSMFQRCYCKKHLESNPTYNGCTVASEWHDFQDFADWYESQPYSEFGYQLDKDILFPNNKVYSSDTCCLVPRELNMLLADGAARRGGTPQGVTAKKPSGKYRALINIDGKQKHLGYFDCPNKAHQVYKKAKESYIRSKALEWKDRINSKVFDSLVTWSLSS